MLKMSWQLKLLFWIARIVYYILYPFIWLLSKIVGKGRA